METAVRKEYAIRMSAGLALQEFLLLNARRSLHGVGLLICADNRVELSDPGPGNRNLTGSKVQKLVLVAI